MLPYTQQHDSLWTRDTLLDTCQLPHDAAGIKKLERLTADAHYFPPVIDAADVKDSLGKGVQNNLLEYEISKIKSRRGKYLIVQQWQHDQHPAMICAHDGRGARVWSFAGADQTEQNHLQHFVDQLAQETSQPLLLFLHAECTERQGKAIADWIADWIAD